MTTKRRRLVNRVAIILVAVVVAAAITVGVLLLDSPVQARLRRFDDRRIADLREIGFAIDAYWSREGSMPSTLEELSSDLRFLDGFADPETGEPYEYRVVAESTYELCAHFSADAARDDRESPLRSLWDHGPGRECFVRDAQKIDRPIEGY